MPEILATPDSGACRKVMFLERERSQAQIAQESARCLTHCNIPLPVRMAADFTSHIAMATSHGPGGATVCRAETNLRPLCQGLCERCRSALLLEPDTAGAAYSEASLEATLIQSLDTIVQGVETMCARSSGTVATCPSSE